MKKVALITLAFYVPTSSLSLATALRKQMSCQNISHQIEFCDEMEILNKFKQNGYFNAELYHLLAKKKMVDPSEEILPSEYEREMRMSTQQRLQNLNSIVVDNIVTPENKKPKKAVLSFTPRLLVFQNFQPDNKIVAKFSVKNISKGPTFLNMVFKESSYFSIKPCGGQLLSRLAPGISVTFAVTFLPIQYEDLIHRVTFYSDVDRYVLALIAMGPRPVFDFPDEIVIPKAPLKVESHVFVKVHNVGTVTAGFTLKAKCPIMVQPKSAYLKSGEKIDVKVGFKTMNLGEVDEILYALFETGENFKIKISGSTHTVSIELEKYMIRFQDTFNTMARQQTLKIINKSNHLLTYMCMKNDCVYYDFEEKVKLATIFYEAKDCESAKNTKLVQFDVISSEEHDRVYTRIFFDEIQSLVADESLQFQNQHFSITPISGNLWPNKATEITISFTPKEIGEFAATAFLDIDGVKDRIPLKMMGASLPPAIYLTLETLDMDRIYINKTYNYEIVAINKGHINGVIVYKDEPTLFGSRISCNPLMHCLRPGEQECFVISFCNSNQGPYFEEMSFIIRDTSVVLKLYLKGEVIYPSLMFSVPCLDFGMVSLGVPKILTVEVINESVVDVSGSVKISSDGPEVSSITLTDYAVTDTPKPHLPQWPKEFHIEPSKLDLGSESRIILTVTLTANLIRANRISLDLELEKSDSPPVILPVMYNAMVPQITPAQEIKLRACFIDFAYQQEIQISSNEFWGYFTVATPPPGKYTLNVEIGKKEGFIKPNSTTTFPITIKTSILGVQEYSIRLNLFGLSKPIEICHITGCGVRPIVTCVPMALHWGQVKLLNRFQKTLTLCNDSPVVVNFKASLLNKDGRWQIDPAEGFIEPESETDISLILYLIDAGSYTNKAVIQLHRVKDILVPLSATGIGTSIVVGELRDRIFLGKHFTKIPLNCKVTMENCGTRIHALEWSEHYKPPKTKQQTAAFFSLDPKVFKMAAGEKVELSIIGVSYKVTTIKETWYLIGSVEGINKKELLLECSVVAEFVDPKIEISSSVVDLQYNYGPYSEYYKLTDILTIKNVSKLPLDIDLSVKPPFAIIQKSSTYKISPEDEDLCCCICYKECDINVPAIVSEAGAKQSRVLIDYLTMKPVEPLRKGSLHFFQDIHKIKMAFILTHFVEERLADQEVMKLQILLDTTKHLSLKSRIYCDVMRVKFKGHKNKDAIKLIGKINFPNMFVMTPRVDFQCLLNGSIESRTIKIQNVTPLLVCYKFNWKKCIISKIAMTELQKDELVKFGGASDRDRDESEPSVTNINENTIIPQNHQPPSEAPIVKINETEGITKEIFTPTEMDSISRDDSEFDVDLIKWKLIKKIAPMIAADYQKEFDWIQKFTKTTNPNRININEVLFLTPYKGLLKPNEIQYVHVIFRPKPNISVRAILECEILGGPPESVIVTGQSSNLMYQLSTQKLNFKIRSFHENATEILVINNIAQFTFEYKTYLDEPKFKNELEGTILDLVPPEKVVDPEENAELKIVMRPGVIGYFNRVFLLEIGHLPHIPIEVFGWGVIPQVYLTLPRPDITKLNPELGYKAITALTSEYLEAVNEIFMNSSSEQLNSPLTDKCFEDADFQQGWHICWSQDGYPSNMDIELAIERMLVINHIKLRPEIMTAYSTTSKMGPIPGFCTTPYVIDFGVVITGSTVQCTADIINYGPKVTKLHFAKGTVLPPWLGMKLCGKLMPGETGKLDVLFAPTSFYFVELEENLELTYHLEVPYGTVIPIQIKALCAVPYLTSNVSVVDFGSVRCGDKIVCSIPLKNVGKPTCIWYVTLRLKGPGPPPMVVLDSSGKYEPEEGGWLRIAFKPTMEMIYDGLLIFRFHMNPNRMTIPVTGQGIVPHVHVVGPNVNFPPTLPWAATTEIYFGLTNPCPFPVELIVVHSDEKWKEEDEVFQFLYKYYNKPDEMLVPVMKPGAGMPPEIINFYKYYREQVKKKSKPVKTTPKSKGTTEASPRKFRTEAEIHADVIKDMKEDNVDPLQECLNVHDHISNDSGSEKYLKGLIVFFHGSPCEEIQSQEMAYSIGKALDIPTVNVDNCIVESLCISKCPAKVSIVTAVNESYEIARRIARDDDYDDEHTEDNFSETEDQYDILSKKIAFIANSKNVATPRSKASEKKKKKSPNFSSSSVEGSHTALGAMGSTTLFQMDLILELLTEFFSLPKFHLGFIIDSLTSIILKNPPLVLTTVLRCKHNIRNLHLVLCQGDFSKWAQMYEESQKDNDYIDEIVPKVYDEKEIDEIIQSFEDMDEEEFEKSSPELKSVYITYGLENRRKKYMEKKGITKQDFETSKKEKASGKSDQSNALLASDPTEKKKTKKEDVKGKVTLEYLAMSNRYTEYNKNTYESLINIANNWIIEECDIGFPILGFNGQVLGASHKKAKKKSEVQLVQISETSFAERGFPLTLIMCPCMQYKEGLLGLFKNAPCIKEALKEEEQHDILKSPVKTEEYTVLLPKTFPTIHHEVSLKWRYLDEMPIKKCECNQLTDLNLLDDSTQDCVLDILSKWHCTCGKKLNSSQTSTSEIPTASVEKITVEESEIETFYPEPLRRVKSLASAPCRLILQPGDLVRCKYSFSPREEGNFSVKRYVEVSGWPDSRTDINVTGICDLPRLDSRPKKMFENFTRRSIEDNVYKITYLDDQKIFEFGPIFIGSSRIYEEEYFINLKNSSLITANVVIEFQQETTVFKLDKTFITLEPGCREKLRISAAPEVVDIYRSVLLFCVKDNPQIVKVTIGCSGVVPIVQILPLTKTIEYGKLLLYRREDDRFIVKNDSILPIMWKIGNAEDFLEDFIISQTSGIIQRRDNQVVPVTYIACRVGVISRMLLNIHIYDALGRGNPLYVDQISLSAECYDVMVECAYENPTENFLNYGNVKVNSNALLDMYLLNRGKYNIYFKLKKVKNFPEPSLLRSFEAFPECGVIPPSPKLICIEFDCTPTTSMNLVNVPAYICSLLDDSKDQVVVAKFPVCVSIASFYNTFTLFPLGELNFHIIPVGSGVTREVILNNTSKCPVTYEIILPLQYQPDPDNPPLVKVKDNKLKNPPLRCGNFMIMNEDNLLPPGTSRTIQIQFLASAAKQFEETIHFVISDTCPAEAQGVPLKLIGTGAMPILDFWNLETTFREHLIVKSLTENKVPESSPHCVFVENSATLHFFCVNVNSSHQGAIDLYNNGLVACALSMKLHYQGNSGPNIFSLDKYETHIEPLLHKNLEIIFSPKALEEYRAVLEIKLKLLDNQTQSFKICLVGEGVIPRIQLVKPKPKRGVLNFPVTCLGSISCKQIEFINISAVKCIVQLDVVQPPCEERPVFWLTTLETCEHIIIVGRNDYENISMKVIVNPDEMSTLVVHYNPITKGKITCEVKLTIHENPYEYFRVTCEAEAFMEDVILVGLTMLSMDLDLNVYKLIDDTANEGSDDVEPSIASTADSAKKTKPGTTLPKNPKSAETKKGRRTSAVAMKQSSASMYSSTLKYLLNFGGCELGVIQRRSVIMINNSDKVYKFTWEEAEYIVTKPSIGYISPGEEKDIEIIFFAGQPVVVSKAFLVCKLIGVNDNFLIIDLKSATWDNRQMITMFDHNRDVSINERCELNIDDQNVPPAEAFLGTITMIVVHSAITEYTKYTCTLKEECNLRDTFIYQTRSFDFNVVNVGNVPMKIVWSFHIEDEYPARIDKYSVQQASEEQPDRQASLDDNDPNVMRTDQPPADNIENAAPSQVTLFSGSADRESVDTWFENDLPFRIEPNKTCLMPKENCQFMVTFSPTDAFDYKVKLKSSIDNLDPYDQNISCKISVKSLIPYVHLEIEESDYLTSGRRKVAGVALPIHMTVLEFNVLGSGCYKKSFNVVNPTNEAYEFIFEMIMSEKELIPVHCNMLKGYVEGGTSVEVTFTFSPTAPGVYESQWRFTIPVYNLVMSLLVVGLVREPDVAFVPTILVIRNSLVGFTTTNVVILKNNENESLNYEFKGNSLCNESGKTPVVVDPDQGVLKPRSETPIKIIYTPIRDGPLSYKIFCSVSFMTKFLALCVNAQGYSINPKVTYYLIGNEHVLNSEAITNIHLDQTASTYQRVVPFKIKNDGSATFFFDWHYVTSSVKKYLQMSVEPKSGHITPGNELECILYFTLKQVPVRAFPVTLSISDGPEYSIYLNADIEKPIYHFSCMNYDFGKCFVNAPDTTYKKNIAFVNDDKVPVILNINFKNIPELYVDYHEESSISPGKRLKVAFYFRPKQVREYEFKLQFWVNSLCEEIITLKGEGIPLLCDLYEGCQKSFDLGPVKVGEKIVRTIEVMNHSKIPINASFIFRDMYPVIEDTTVSEATSVCLSSSQVNVQADAGPSRVQMLQVYKNDKIRDQILMDTENALSSLKVIPNKCIIMPYRTAPLKIQFKPIGMISNLDIQLNMKVLSFERPLVKLSGSATGMSLCFSQNSLQFGRVRKRGCKKLKVMLLNKGDFGARFWWQPLKSEEFTILPEKGHVAAHANVTFTITFRPANHNPFIKIWASCNIENYKPLELAMYATCVALGTIQNKTMYLECPVREVVTDYIIITNPSDEVWLVLSEISEGPFETPKEFNVEPNSTIEIPVHFKPKHYGKHEAQLMYSPLGETALFVSVIGLAGNPNPNGNLIITVPAKESHTENLLVYNITEKPESYAVATEIVKIIPDKFGGFYDIKYPEKVKVWGEASATCTWTFVCYEECEMQLKVMFVNEESREYQFYNITATITPSAIVDTLVFESRARETVQKKLVIKNALNSEAEYSIYCAKLKCPESVNIGQCSETVITMDYSPLVVGETEDFLEVRNVLAGSYIYKIILKCLPAKVKELDVSTPLGTCVPMRLRVHNNTDSKTEFTTMVSDPSIQTENVYILGPNEKGKFVIWFEPTKLGIQQCTVSFNSVTAGEFVFKINSVGTTPKPQGPFEIKAGGSIAIKFKNVFVDTQMFRIHLDREEFYVKTYYEPVRAKKDLKITVYLNQTLALASPKLPTGSLTIENCDPPGPIIKWTYFLQGIP